MIDADALTERVKSEMGFVSCADTWMIQDLIDAQPTIEPQIIHCKDCKYAHMTYRGECKYCDIWSPDEKCYMDGDYYCASAERRTDEND